VNRGQGWIVWLAALSPTFAGVLYTAIELKVNVFFFLVSPLVSMISDAVIKQERVRRLRRD